MVCTAVEDTNRSAVNLEESTTTGLDEESASFFHTFHRVVPTASKVNYSVA
jgi:hypothetical protein